MRICGRSCPLSKPSSMPTSSTQCLARLKATMQSHFGYSDFRPGQLEALFPVVHGRDVFVSMPTGGGKTLYVSSISYESYSYGTYNKSTCCPN